MMTMRILWNFDISSADESGTGHQKADPPARQE
jgi:hypothetical protein